MSSWLTRLFSSLKADDGTQPHCPACKKPYGTYDEYDGAYCLNCGWSWEDEEEKYQHGTQLLLFEDENF